jgi:zinc transporter ZupT
MYALQLSFFCFPFQFLELHSRLPYRKFWMGLANSFSAGIFLATGVMHMLPDAIHALGEHHLSVASGNYPLALLLCLVGFSVVFFAERAVINGGHDGIVVSTAPHGNHDNHVQQLPKDFGWHRNFTRTVSQNTMVHVDACCDVDSCCESENDSDSESEAAAATMSFDSSTGMQHLQHDHKEPDWVFNQCQLSGHDSIALSVHNARATMPCQGTLLSVSGESEALHPSISDCGYLSTAQCHGHDRMVVRPTKPHSRMFDRLMVRSLAAAASTTATVVPGPGRGRGRGRGRGPDAASSGHAHFIAHHPVNSKLTDTAPPGPVPATLFHHDIDDRAVEEYTTMHTGRLDVEQRRKKGPAQPLPSESPHPARHAIVAVDNDVPLCVRVHYSSHMYESGLRAGLDIANALQHRSSNASCVVPVAEIHESKTNPTPYIVVGMLAVHSILAGMAIGLDDSKQQAGILLGALTFHKFTAAMSLGIVFLKAKVSRIKALRMVLGFSFSTPIGIAAGMALLSAGYADSILPGIFMAIGSGTFLYIGIMEMLVEEFIEHTNHRYHKFAMYTLGVGVMSVISIFV